MDRTNLETTEEFETEIAVDESIATEKIKELMKATMDQTINDYIQNRIERIGFKRGYYGYTVKADRKFERRFINSDSPVLHLYCDVFNVPVEVLRRKVLKMFDYIDSRPKSWKRKSFTEKKLDIINHLND